MAHADPSGARKRTTRKTKSTSDIDDDNFLYDFVLPSVHLPPVMDQLQTEDSKQAKSGLSGTPLNTQGALAIGSKPSSDEQSFAEQDISQRITLVQDEREKLALELELLRL